MTDGVRRVAVVFALQSWLAETSEQRKTAATPAYFSVGMSGKLVTVHQHAILADFFSHVLARILHASVLTTSSSSSSRRLWY